MARNLTGQTLAGRYQFVVQIGQGSFAQVYRVRDLRRGVDMAAKVLREDMALEPSFMERFKREASVLQRLQHPYIVRYYETVEADGVTFILLDFIDGETMQALLARKSRPFTLEESIAFVQPITSALAYAHGEGIVHRDIKPGNILISRESRVYVTDFGIARLMNDAGTLTAGSSIGTPLYMAPEQIQAQQVTLSADIYAFGVLLYQMFTGRVPFVGDRPGAQGLTTGQRVAYEHVHIPPTHPQSLNPNLSSRCTRR
ncbi:MAG: serine/threonine protein kinase [Anaerolineae bacterium]|nr:serine/threonine protein kinase [Anaerolineae bacterium]